MVHVPHSDGEQEFLKRGLILYILCLLWYHCTVHPTQIHMYNVILIEASATEKHQLQEYKPQVCIVSGPNATLNDQIKF